jgi:hypothetical protein
MRPYLLAITAALSIAITSCSKTKDCGCAPPPPLLNTEWKVVNYSNWPGATNVNLPDNQQPTLSFAAGKFTFVDKPSGDITSGTYATLPGASGAESEFQINFNKTIPIFGKDQMMATKNRNDSLVLIQLVANGSAYTLTRIR